MDGRYNLVCYDYINKNHTMGVGARLSYEVYVLDTRNIPSKKYQYFWFKTSFDFAYPLTRMLYDL